jgi:hypothetical protein
VKTFGASVSFLLLTFLSLPLYALDCQDLSKTFQEGSPKQNLDLLVGHALSWLEEIPATKSEALLFKSRFEKGLLSVQVLTPQNQSGFGFPAGVVAVFDPDSVMKMIQNNSMTGTLFLNPSHELGFFIPSFFHELVHSIDDSYFQALKERNTLLKKSLHSGGSASQTDQIQKTTTEIQEGAGFSSERKAYDLQYQAVQSLIDILPCAKEYYQGLQDKGVANFLATAKSKKIIDKYGFQPGPVSSYLMKKGKLNDLER